MNIFIIDEFGPEPTAMLQALYSRSAESVVEHVAKVKERGSSKFMESYYVGYGHASIGDCGFTALFFEDVSVLAAKVIQDNPLYSGQETSTRYIDFSTQDLISPIETDRSRSTHQRWIEFYLESRSAVMASLRRRFPITAGQKEAVWEKAIQARAFDILRGFLPAGVATQLSWTTNLRQAADNLARMRHHPLKEVQAIAESALRQLKAKYPSSFSHTVNNNREEYLRQTQAVSAYLAPHSMSEQAFVARTLVIDNEARSQFAELLRDRPRHALLPRACAKIGRFRFEFLLDFGSFRDLQRHRNGLCSMPLLTTKLGFNSWYLQQLPDTIRTTATVLIDQQERELAALIHERNLNDIEAQYFIPMGYNVFCSLDYDISQTAYVSELRSATTVHPTLRIIANQMASYAQTQFPELVLYNDKSVDELDIHRGTQDIEERIQDV